MTQYIGFFFRTFRQDKIKRRYTLILINILNLVVQTALPLTFPGCLPKFDVLAQLFTHSDAEERKNLIKDTEKLSKKCCKNKPEKELSAQKYVQLMKSSLDNNKDDSEAILMYFFSEENRLKRLLGGNVSNKKKIELQTSINIIQSFKTNANIKKNILEHFENHGSYFYNQFKEAEYPKGKFIAK